MTIIIKGDKIKWNFQDKYNQEGVKNMIMGFDGVNPKISKSAYISESVDIIGNVEINENANICLELGLELIWTKL